MKINMKYPRDYYENHFCHYYEYHNEISRREMINENLRDSYEMVHFH